ncbi:MAG: calcium-binding protein [Xenococcus sp. (in: cyanobacteria)]
MNVLNLLITNTILGSLGDDSIFGSNSLDYILGLLGNDTLNGQENNDILIGGYGNDSLEGEAGLDFLIGGHGNDTLDGGDDDDYLYGGNGFDVLLGNQGNDTLKGGNENDTVKGGVGHDLLDGGSGDDYLDGGAGDDTLQTGVSIKNTNFLNSNLSIINLANTNFHRVQSQIHQVLAAMEFMLALYDGDSRFSNSEILSTDFGNDTLDGGAGYDIVDYTEFGQAITLTATGIVEKANGQSDFLVDIEKIIGAVGQDNKIDAISAFGDTVYLDADLSTNRLTVKGIPRLGELNFEVENFRHMSGTNQSDRMIGNHDNNILEGHSGNDTLDGGVGFDIVDYTRFDQAVTLTPMGIVEKSNGQSDFLVDIEKIIGAVGQDNKIEAISVPGDSVYLDVDLSANRLTVKGIPEIREQNFEMVNFRHVSATNQEDIISGDFQDNIIEGHDGNDIIYAGLGYDTLDGGGYFDIVDYNNFGQAVTMKPMGVMEKANGQSDLLVDVEKIVGALGEYNQIDASSISGDTANLYVDLSLEQVIVKDIPILGQQDFQVVNFLHVSGTNQADTIIGNSHENILEGNGGNDVLIGSNQNYYNEEIDILIGGDGADSFVLGDSVQAYYQGDSWAKITDFDSWEGDRLVVFGTAADYTVSDFEDGINIAYQGDIVAFITNTTQVDLDTDFEFVEI